MTRKLHSRVFMTGSAVRSGRCEPRRIARFTKSSCEDGTSMQWKTASTRGVVGALNGCAKSSMMLGVKCPAKTDAQALVGDALREACADAQRIFAGAAGVDSGPPRFFLGK